MTRKDSRIQFLQYRVEALENQIKKNEEWFDAIIAHFNLQLNKFRELDKRLKDENRKLKNSK